MTDTNKSLLLDLNFRTALLESVDWDDEQSASLLEYLQFVLKENTALPDEVLRTIKHNYGMQAHNIIEKMFIDEYVNQGLYVENEDNYDH